MPTIGSIIARDTIKYEDFINMYPRVKAILQEMKDDPEICEWCFGSVEAHEDDCPTLFYEELQA